MLLGGDGSWNAYLQRTFLLASLDPQKASFLLNGVCAFVLIREALSRMIDAAGKVGFISGLKLAREAPSINHLQFADDTMIFCELTEEHEGYFVMF